MSSGQIRVFHGGLVRLNIILFWSRDSDFLVCFTILYFLGRHISIEIH